MTIKMHRTLTFILLTALFLKLGYSQTATNFNVPDCSGIYYELFENLDAGKIVVIGWTMPCNPCILPLLTTYNVVQSYQASHPDIVQMLLADDYGDTPCIIINAWANTNGLINTRRFSHPDINMLDYGTTGMPKVVVIGADRKVYFNADNQVDHNKLIEAINLALESLTTSVHEHSPSKAALKIYPNPVTGNSIISVEFENHTSFKISLLNIFGQEVVKLYDGSAKSEQIPLSLRLAEIPTGMYLVRMQTDNETVVRKIHVIR